jgi:alpha-1,3-rhamnosyl/mannosyltransferase
LPAITERLVACGQLRFLANISNEELRGLYEGTRLLAYPSIYEGFGMPVVEAFACGSPVAHSAETAMDEVSGGYATRVAAMDVIQWTNVLETAIESNEHNNPVAREMRMHRASEFSWDSSARLVKQAYQRAFE